MANPNHDEKGRFSSGSGGPRGPKTGGKRTKMDAIAERDPELADKLESLADRYEEEKAHADAGDERAKQKAYEIKERYNELQSKLPQHLQHHIAADLDAPGHLVGDDGSEISKSHEKIAKRKAFGEDGPDSAQAARRHTNRGSSIMGPPRRAAEGSGPRDALPPKAPLGRTPRGAAFGRRNVGHIEEPDRELPPKAPLGRTRHGAAWGRRNVGRITGGSGPRSRQ